MLGFWVKAYYATVAVFPIYYGVVKLVNKKPTIPRILLALFCFIISPILLLIAYLNIPIYYLEPHIGQVIEAGTGNPVSGVAVIVSNYEDWPAVHGSMTEYIDTRETSTNKKGKFYLPGDWQFRRGGTPYGQIQVFKPGYSVTNRYHRTFIDKIFWKEYDEVFRNIGCQIYEVEKLEAKNDLEDNLRRVETLNASSEKIWYTLTLIDLEERNLKSMPPPPPIPGTVLPSTPLWRMKIVTINCNQGTAVVQDMQTKKDGLIKVGDVVCIENAVVIAIDNHQIGLRLSKFSKRYLQIPEMQCK